MKVIPLRQTQFHNFDLTKTHEYFREVSRNHQVAVQMDQRNRERLTEYQIRLRNYYLFFDE